MLSSIDELLDGDHLVHQWWLVQFWGKINIQRIDGLDFLFLDSCQAAHYAKDEVHHICSDEDTTGDDRMYVFYTLFNLPGKWSSLHRSDGEKLMLWLEIYLIVCFIDNAPLWPPMWSASMKPIWSANESVHLEIERRCCSARTFSFRAISIDVRNSIDRVHQRVGSSFSLLCCSKMFSQG